MSGAAGGFSPRYVRLSGEIADQAVLDGLKQAFPDASVGHAHIRFVSALDVTAAGKLARGDAESDAKTDAKSNA